MAQKSCWPMCCLTLHPPPAAPSLLVYSQPQLHRQHGERILLAAAREAEAAGVRCTWKISSGDVVEQIEAVVDEWKPGRVVVGSHGETKFCLGILGSTAERLFQRLGVPVLAVGPEVRSHSAQLPKGIRVLAPISLQAGITRRAQFCSPIRCGS